MCGKRQKTFVICTEHSDINIVVPRDKATVTHRTQHGARVNEPLNIVRCTIISKHLEDLEFGLLQALERIIKLHLTPPTDQIVNQQYRTGKQLRGPRNVKYV